MLSHDELALSTENGQEYLNRPTAPVAWWSSPNEHVLGGHDLLRNAHGTWLGVTKDGRIAVLTNFREQGDMAEGAVSRGAMVNAFLTQAPDAVEDTEKFVQKLIDGEGVRGVGGFSLLCGKMGQPLAVVSNRTPSIEGVTWIATGKGQTGGLSNAAYGDRSWPKVVQGEELLASATKMSIKRGDNKEQFIEEMMRILSTDTLPKRGENEGWDRYVMQLRNSIFIPVLGGEGRNGVKVDDIASSEDRRCVGSPKPSSTGTAMSGVYGTQKQTVVLMDNDRRVTFVERTLYDDLARPTLEYGRDRVFEFDIQE